MAYTHQEHPAHEGYPEASSAYKCALDALDDGGHLRKNIREKAYRQALAEMEATHGAESKPVGAAYYYLISYLQGAHQHAKATPLWAKLFRIEEQNYDVPHWELAGTLNNIGLHLDRLGDQDESEVFLRWAIAMHEHTDHDHGVALFNLGMVLHRRDEFRRSSVLFARAMTDAKKAHTRAEAIFMLALDTNQLGTLDEAACAIGEAVKQHRGDDFDLFGSMLLQYGAALAAVDRTDDALIVAEEVIKNASEAMERRDTERERGDTERGDEVDLLTSGHALRIAILVQAERPYVADKARADARDELGLDMSKNVRARNDYDGAISNWNWKLRLLTQDARRDHPGDYVYTLCKIIADGDLETEISTIDRAIGKDTLTASYRRALMERKLDLYFRLGREHDAEALLNDDDVVVVGLAAARLGRFDDLETRIRTLEAPIRKRVNKRW